MSTLALLDDGPYVSVVPKRFRFSDENPLTLEPYGRNRIGDLPPYIEDVITGVVGVSVETWDRLVDEGETYTLVGPYAWYSLEGFLRSVRARGHRRGPKGACQDCWGTLAMLDFDGSMTGRIGAAFVCPCVQAVSGW